MKSSRLQYKRKWIAASRSLNHMSNDLHNSDDSTSESPVEDTTSEDAGSTEFDKSSGSSSHTTIQDQPDLSDCESENSEAWGLVQQDAPSDSSTEFENESLTNSLTKWVNEFQVKHNAVDGLLKLLQKSGHPDLPTSARSLLSTVRDVPTQIKSGMEYIYFGLNDVLLKNFKKYPLTTRENVDVLDISFNIDGLPLFKSSGKGLWPILCAIMNVEPVTVFPVALTFGISKPSNLDFLQDTIRDLNYMLQHGMKDGEETIGITLRCITCDAPSKALVKAIKQYSGYFGCDKCAQRGVWVGRLTYQDVDNVELRTDESFRNQSNEEHHHGVSPFCDLPTDMVKQFPIDYMHQSCLGMMKKLILTWMRGKKEVKMSALQICQISGKLVALKRCIPSNFARKPRGLNEVDRWKATEFRQFLLYTEKIVLRGILRQCMYEHFMTLSVAISILICPRIAVAHRNYAHELLIYFVKQCSNLYGNEFLVYNVHCMIHLAADVEEYGSLDRFGAFPFENHMQQLKRFVRSGKNPIAQTAKRLSESYGSQTLEHQTNTKISFKKPNNCYIINDASCCEVVGNAAGERDEDGNQLFLCRVYNRTDPLFEQPCDSRIIGIHAVNERHVHMQVLPESSLERRAIKVEVQQDYAAVFLAILHKF